MNKYFESTPWVMEMVFAGFVLLFIMVLLGITVQKTILDIRKSTLNHQTTMTVSEYICPHKTSNCGEYAIDRKAS